MSYTRTYVTARRYIPRLVYWRRGDNKSDTFTISIFLAFWSVFITSLLFAGIFCFHRTRAEERVRVYADEVPGNRAATDKGRRTCCEHKHWRSSQTEAVLCTLGNENLQLTYSGLWITLTCKSVAC